MLGNGLPPGVRREASGKAIGDDPAAAQSLPTQAAGVRRCASVVSFFMLDAAGVGSSAEGSATSTGLPIGRWPSEEPGPARRAKIR